MNKKITVLLLTLVMLLTSFTFASNAASTTKRIQVGNYIVFGRYNGDPILWRVININKDGSALIFSERILCLKPLDSAESGITGKLGGKYTKDEFRQKYGSNRWSNSNLREWLNSNLKTVKYITQAPIDKAVYGGMNDYANEAGFLSNFTKKEQSYIAPTGHKSLLAKVDSGSKDGGKEIHISNLDIKNSVANYEFTYYENVTDKVFVLDIKELYDYVYKKGWEYRRIPADKALDRSENLWGGRNVRKYFEEKSYKYWFYWLRTPGANYSSSMRYVRENGQLDESGVISGSCGVAPALTLKADMPVVGGNGSIDKPYIVGEIINKPSAPKNLKTNRNGTNVTITWNSVSGVDGYYIYMKKGSGSYSKEYLKTTSKKITGLEKLQKYYFKVSAANIAGEGGVSKEIRYVP